MLVLTRKVGERIQIGNDITVVVTKTAGNRVTLGIEAPKNIRIVRGELEEYVNAFGEEEASAEEDEKAVSVPFPFLAADPSTYVPSQAK